MFNCNFFFEKQDKTVKSRFWLFNSCNSETKWQNRPTWGRKECKKTFSVFGLRPSVSFCSASAKNFHFGASLIMTFLFFVFVTQLVRQCAAKTTAYPLFSVTLDAC